MMKYPNPLCHLCLGASGETRFAWSAQRARAPTVAELTASGFEGSHFVDAVGDESATNLLLLLHGLGDTPRPFAQLARTLALPQTASLALRAPVPLPCDMDGACWHTSFDPDGHVIGPLSGIDRLQSLERESRVRLRRLVQLLEACGWPAHQIFLFGYAQGGTAALDFALHAPSRLGGVVSFCGLPLEEALRAPIKRAEEAAAAAGGTPCLLVAAAADAQTPVAHARAMFGWLQSAWPCDEVELCEVGGTGAMAASEAEWRPVVEFFAKHIALRNHALERDLVHVDQAPEGLQV